MKILMVSYVDPDIVTELEKEHDVICNFKATDEEIRKLIVDRDMLIFRSGVNITADVMRLAPNLKYLIRAGSGLDNIDLDYVNEHKFGFFRIPEPGARAVTEMAFGFMLALARQFRQLDLATREGRWLKLSAEGYLLRGKSLGVVGVGNIGTQVAKMGVLWGMTVRGCVEHTSQEKKEELRRENIELVAFDDVIRQSDYITLNVQLHDTTRNLINADAIARMKQGAILINLARGGVVDELALREALVSGHLRGAALDVHKAEGDGKISPLADLPNVILTPHIGAQTVDTQREIGNRILQIINHEIREMA